MITFFTTTKDFLGENKISQINALKSWKEARNDVEILVFGDSEGVHELSKELCFIHIPKVKVSKQNTPYISNMFEQVSLLARHKICCFINADILISKRFVKTIIDLQNIIGKNYLLVGQRKDVHLNEIINFDADWEAEIDQLTAECGSTHPPSGSDFFAFPKDQYRPGDIPDLLVGRGGWDLWMIYNGRVRDFKVVDISREIMIVHQNHDYSHRKQNFVGYGQDEEAQINLKYLPEEEKYSYTLMACNYYYESGKLHLNFARGNLKKFIDYELSLMKNIWGISWIQKALKKFHII